MTIDQEWLELGATWRGVTAGAVDAGPVDQIRTLVTRQSRRMRIYLALEIALTIAAFVPVAWVVARNPNRATIGWAIAATLHSALVWAFALSNRRGTWSPMAETTRAYLTLAIERTRRELRAARFAVALLAVESILIVGWILATGPRSGWHWLAPAGVIFGVGGWAAWMLADAPRRLARLQELDRALELDEAVEPREPAG